jgi:ankyrin repeat protein
VCALSLVATSVPYGWWQIGFASRLARGPYAADFLVTSASEGEQRVVKSLLTNGLDVNARTRNGSTALHAAALAGQLLLVEFLVAGGADINAINRYGDSPLADAEASGQKAVGDFLRAQGAHLIRGTDEQRERVSREIIREHMGTSN